MVGQLHHGKLKFQAPTSGNLQYVADNGKFVLYPPTFTFQTDTTALTPPLPARASFVIWEERGIQGMLFKYNSRTLNNN